jgi:hypothetical protein
MNYTTLALSRRKALQMALTVGGAACVQPIASLLAAETNRPPTFPNVLGPFYPVIKPMEKDADLTRIRGHKRGAEGKIIHLMGLQHGASRCRPRVLTRRRCKDNITRTQRPVREPDGQERLCLTKDTPLESLLMAPAVRRAFGRNDSRAVGDPFPASQPGAPA